MQYREIEVNLNTEKEPERTLEDCESGVMGNERVNKLGADINPEGACTSEINKRPSDCPDIIGIYKTTSVHHGYDERCAHVEEEASKAQGTLYAFG